jgi:iron-sulfur cluster assembly protein
MITLTENAKHKFQEQLEQRGKGIGIAIGVKKTGCSGYSYTLDFLDESISGEFVNCGDFIVLVKPDAEPFLNGITIDYVKQGLNEKFDFINPNETARCGCGESFTV